MTLVNGPADLLDVVLSVMVQSPVLPTLNVRYVPFVVSSISEKEIWCHLVSQIDCSDDDTVCRNYEIDATSATSLSLNCSDDCSGATILCPTGDSTSCSIIVGWSSSLQYATIELAEDATISTFALDCGDESYSCRYTSLILPSTSTVDDVSIQCSGQYTCQDSSFVIASDIINDFNLSCSSYGCRNMDIEVRSLNMQAFHWECIDSSSCSGASIVMNVIESFIHSVDIICSGYQGCYAMALNAPYTNISELSIQCTGTQSCQSATIQSIMTSGGAAHVECASGSGCYGTTIDLQTHSNTNIAIDCANGDISSSTSSSACQNGNFNVQGISEPQMTTLSMNCHQYDCYSLDLVVQDLSNVYIDCQATC